MVRSRCQARPDTFSSLIASSGVRFIVPFPPQELVMRETLRWASLPSINGCDIFLKVAGRAEEGCTLTFSARLELWPSGKTDMSINFSEELQFFLLWEFYNLKILVSSSWVECVSLDATCKSRQGSHLGSFCSSS